MTTLLGFASCDERRQRTRLRPAPTRRATRGPGGAPERPRRDGLGTVHHVAFAIGSAEAQLAAAGRAAGGGPRRDQVRDRTYFQSIYFREPGGVLFEVATIGAGLRRGRAARGPWDAGCGCRRGRSRTAPRSRPAPRLEPPPLLDVAAVPAAIREAYEFHTVDSA